MATKYAVTLVKNIYKLLCLSYFRKYKNIFSIIFQHWNTVTVKITGLRTADVKTHVRPVNLLYIIMFKIRKIKPNSGSVYQKPKSFHSDWKWHRWLQSFLMEDKDLFILQGQCQGCWWPGDAKKQDISKHGIYLVSSEWYGAASRVNSLAPGKFARNFRQVIFKQILVTDGWGISCEIALIWKSLGFTDDQSTLVQVMAWCCQATSHYLNQCWSRSPTP